MKTKLSSTYKHQLYMVVIILIGWTCCLHIIKNSWWTGIGNDFDKRGIIWWIPYEKQLNFLEKSSSRIASRRRSLHWVCIHVSETPAGNTHNLPVVMQRCSADAMIGFRCCAKLQGFPLSEKVSSEIKADPRVSHFPFFRKKTYLLHTLIRKCVLE